MVRPSFWEAFQNKAQLFFALQLLHNKRVSCECWLLRGKEGGGGGGGRGGAAREGRKDDRKKAGKALSLLLCIATLHLLLCHANDVNLQSYTDKENCFGAWYLNVFTHLSECCGRSRTSVAPSNDAAPQQLAGGVQQGQHGLPTKPAPCSHALSQAQSQMWYR